MTGNITANAYSTTLISLNIDWGMLPVAYNTSINIYVGLNSWHVI